MNPISMSSLPMNFMMFAFQYYHHPLEDIKWNSGLLIPKENLVACGEHTFIIPAPIPANNGHVVVGTRTDFDSISNLSADVYRELIYILTVLSAIMPEVFGDTDSNIACSSGMIYEKILFPGQVVPRSQDDHTGIKVFDYINSSYKETIDYIKPNTAERAHILRTLFESAIPPKMVIPVNFGLPYIQASPYSKYLEKERHNIDFGGFTVYDYEVIAITELAVCFTNIREYVPGHILITPLRYVPYMRELTPEELLEIYEMGRDMGKVVALVYGGAFDCMNRQDGPASGQTVNQFHIHVLSIPLPDLPVEHNIEQTSEQRAEQANMLRSVMANWPNEQIQTKS